MIGTSSSSEPQQSSFHLRNDRRFQMPELSIISLSRASIIGENQASPATIPGVDDFGQSDGPEWLDRLQEKAMRWQGHILSAFPESPTPNYINRPYVIHVL